MSKREEKAKILANFRVNEEDWINFGNMSRQMFGHGAISKLLQDYVKTWLQKNDGKTPRMDKFLDPNFVPKPIAYDNIEKNVLPYAANLSDTDLHEFRIWCYQAYNVCMALSKMKPNQRKNCTMSYDQLFDLVYKEG